MALKYPQKPWKEGQQAELLKGMWFVYSSSMKKWIPVTPGYESQQQLETAFGVSTVVELNTKLADIDEQNRVLETKTVALESQAQALVTTTATLTSKAQTLETKTASLETKALSLDSDIQLSGRIWKSSSKPTAPANNDVWMEAASGKLFNYDATYDTWVEK